MTTILLVDDEIEFGFLLSESLKRLGISCLNCCSIKEAKNKLSEHPEIDVVITDLNLHTALNGFDLVRYVNENYPNIPIAVISAYSDDEGLIDALKQGAFDYITKPIEPERLKILIERASLAAANNKKTSMDNQSEEYLHLTSDLIGESEAIKKVKSTLSKIARTQAPVFITGESGTGKEVVAGLIHKLSSRSNGPFIPINCGAIPLDLIESVLFGYKKGSFTGADKESLGLIRSADGGTLFLDEIADLPLPLQVKLLRVVQEKKVRPLGSDVEYLTDFRVISATHRDLFALVKSKEFREDLYFRLYVMSISLPPLRERGDDVLLLAEKFCSKICDEWAIEKKQISEPVRYWLLNQRFSGNVRELQNTIERAITLSEDNEITLGDIADIADISGEAKEWNNQPIILSENQKFRVTDDGYSSVVTEPLLNVYIPEREGLDAYLEGIETAILLKTMSESRNSKTVAAKRLGITFRSLRYRLKKRGYDTED